MGSLTFGVVFACAIAAIGSGFQHGYNGGIVNSPKLVIEDWLRTVLHASEDWLTYMYSLAASIFCIGGIFGSLFSSVLATFMGRKGALMFNNIFAVLASVLMGLAKPIKIFEMFLAGRFISGLNCGINSGLAAMYCVEISPQEVRGALGTLYQLVITISILLSQIFGSNQLLGTEASWPILFWIVGGVAVGQFLGLIFCPESPKHYLAKGKEDKVQASLKRLRGTDDVAAEYASMKAEAEKEKSVGRAGLCDFIQNPLLRKPLLVCVMLMLAQQLSGINAVIYYSTDTFSKANLSQSEAQIATMIMGAMNVLMTVISMFLVEIFGRKTLLIAGFFLMFVDTCLLTLALNLIDKGIVISYLCVLLIVLFVVCFAIGPGSIPWFIVAELFGQDARPFAASVAACVNWTANFLVGMLFLPLQETLHAYVFIIFAVLQILFTFIILLIVPETKNKTLDEILKNFKKD